MPTPLRTLDPIRAAAPLALGLLGLAFGLALGCRPPASPPRPRQVVLISVDTLRADKLGCYGYERPVSPAMDELAATGVLFADAMATSPWTLPSHGSLLSGLYPNRHGLEDYDQRLPAEVVTLAEAFAASGWDTAAFVNSPNVGARYGLDGGFHEFTIVERDSEAREPSGIDALAAEWIAAHAEVPFFLFLHFYDVHSAYASLPEIEASFVRPGNSRLHGTNPELLKLRARGKGLREGQVRRLTDLYVAGIRQMDDGIRRVLESLEENGLADEALVILTSDHGEEFGEHGGVLHGQTQYQEVLHVPLLLRGPGLPRGVRVEAPVSLVDVYPTALAAAGLVPPPGLDGVDLTPLWREAPPGALAERFLFSSADHNRPGGNDLSRAVRYRNFKLVLDRHGGAESLFDLDSDAGESTDVAERHPELTALLKARLQAYLAREAAQGVELPPLDAEEIAELKALGYL